LKKQKKAIGKRDNRNVESSDNSGSSDKESEEPQDLAEDEVRSVGMSSDARRIGKLANKKDKKQAQAEESEEQHEGSVDSSMASIFGDDSSEEISSKPTKRAKR